MNLIAEGEFDLGKENIQTNCYGGADIFISKIDIGKWKFYNGKDKEIIPSNELVSNIEKSLF